MRVLSERPAGFGRWLALVQEAGKEGEAKEESYQAFLKELCIFEQQVCTAPRIHSPSLLADVLFWMERLRLRLGVRRRQGGSIW